MTVSNFNEGSLEGRVAELNNKITPIGTVSTAENSSGETTSDSTWTTIKTLSLVAGTYVVTGDLTFNTSSNGIRILILDTTESTVNLYDNSVLATGRADLSKTRIVTLMSIAGKSKRCGNVFIPFTASVASEPSEGIGAATPSPKKLK